MCIKGPTKVAYVPKTNPGDPHPWLEFGSSQEDYEKWVPHVCGICCLKMVGDTLGRTRELSLYQLTMMCMERGGFRESVEGIAGVFHHPLVALAEGLGIPAEVVRKLDDTRLMREISSGRLAVLSIDLARVGPGLKGGHLILVHGYEPDEDAFRVHDCSSVLRKNGQDVTIPRKELDRYSNKKGIVMG